MVYVRFKVSLENMSYFVIVTENRKHVFSFLHSVLFLYLINPIREAFIKKTIFLLTFVNKDFTPPPPNY